MHRSSLRAAALSPDDSGLKRERQSEVGILEKTRTYVGIFLHSLLLLRIRLYFSFAFAISGCVIEPIANTIAVAMTNKIRRVETLDDETGEIASACGIRRRSTAGVRSR